MFIFDFPLQDRPTFLQCLLVLVFYLFVVVKLYKKNIVNYIPYNTTKKQTYLLLIVVIIGIVFYMPAGDFWHYQNYVVWEHSLLDSEHNHLENAYTPVVAFVSRNYFLFRVIVWGGATVITYLFFKRLNISPYHALFVLFSCELSNFAYGRVSLALALYFLGVALLFQESKLLKVLKYILGGFLIFSSYFFHHSMLMLIAITPVIILPINKYTMFVFFLSIPLLINLMSYVMGDMLINELLEEEGILDSVTRYSESRSYTGFKLIQKYYSYAIVFVSFYYFIKPIFQGRQLLLSKDVLGVWKLYVCTVVIAVLTFAVVPTDLFFYRFIGMTSIPFCVLMSYYHEHNLLDNHTFKNLWLLNVSSLFIVILYKCYATSIGIS